MKAYEDIIIRPYITEKSNIEVSSGKYTFVVDKRATKVDVRKAVEALFNVRVISVNVQNYNVFIYILTFHKGPDLKSKIYKTIFIPVKYS